MTTTDYTPRDHLNQMERDIRDGVYVEVHALMAARDAADAADRITTLAADGEMVHAQQRAAKDQARAQQFAKDQVRERLNSTPGGLNWAYTRAVEALRELLDQSADYRAQVNAGAVAFTAAGVTPRVEPSDSQDGADLSRIDPENHTVYGYGDYSTVRALVSDGVVHNPALPSEWLLAALAEVANSVDATGARRSLELRGGGNIESLIGRRDRPYLPL